MALQEIFSPLRLTNKGLALQAKMQAGEVLNITRVAIGDGTPANDEDILLFTEIVQDIESHTSDVTADSATVDIVQNIPIADGKTLLKITVQNGNRGFYLREIGIFAQDPDEGEILYAYTYCGDSARYTPSYDGTNRIYKDYILITSIGNAENAEPSTWSEIEKAIAEMYELYIEPTGFKFDCIIPPIAGNEELYDELLTSSSDSDTVSFAKDYSFTIRQTADEKITDYTVTIPQGTTFYSTEDIYNLTIGVHWHFDKNGFSVDTEQFYLSTNISAIKPSTSWIDRLINFNLFTIQDGSVWSTSNNRSVSLFHSLTELFDTKVNNDQYASTTEYGLVKFASSGGISNPNGISVNTSSEYGTTKKNGYVATTAATEAEIDEAENAYKPIVPKNLKYAIRNKADIIVNSVNATDLVKIYDASGENLNIGGFTKLIGEPSKDNPATFTNIFTIAINDTEIDLVGKGIFAGDTLDCITGKITRNYAVYTLTGTETFYLGTNGFYFSIPDGYPAKKPKESNSNFLCTHYQSKTKTSISDLYLNGAPDNKYLYIYDSNFITTNEDGSLSNVDGNVQAFTTQLETWYENGTPVRILYPVAEATTEIIQLPELTLKKGSNTIYAASDLVSGTNFSIEYEADTKLYIDTLFNKLQKTTNSDEGTEVAE